MKLCTRRLMVVLATVVVGCASAPPQQAGFKAERAARKSLDQMVQVPALASATKVTTASGALLPVVRAPETAAAHPWLAKKRVKLEIRRPVALSEIIRMLWAQGINFTSQLPLGEYTYAGLGINETDGETALRLLLGTLGLDYSVNDARETVEILPMASRTWYLNLGNRRSSYTSGTVIAGAQQGAGAQGQGTQQSGASATGLASASPAAGGAVGAPGAVTGATAPPGSSGAQGASGQGGAGIAVSDDFWAALRLELGARLMIMIPNTPTPSGNSSLAGGGGPGLPPLPGSSSTAPGMSAGFTSPGSGGQPQQEMYLRKQIGAFSVNAETGAITVQAPHWVLADLDRYLARVGEMYNTDITFTGRLMMVVANQKQSEGLDVAAFARFAAARWGVTYSNNALGGVTLTFPDSASRIPSISTGVQPVAGTLLGVQGRLDGLQAFNGYLESVGDVSIIQKPVLSTTSGVPVEFSRIDTRYYNSVSQQAASGGTGSAAVATQNTLVPVDLGTILRINPRIDVAKELVRAQIFLNQTIQSGTQTVNQSVSSGAVIQQVPLELPTITKLSYAGEALLRDGDLIILGGQTEDNGTSTNGGVTGLKDGPLGGLFGQQRRDTTVSTYYFALQVKVQKR